MKPDFSLLMMFLAIILFPDKKNVLLVGLATGIISGLTTTVPGGFLPNVIDKVVTSLLFYGLFLLIKKNRSIIMNAILTAIGTIISGTVFLSAAILLISFADSFFILFITIVLPAAVINTIAMVIIYPVVYKIAQKSKMITFA